MIGGVEERRMGGKYKVRSHPGAETDDIYYHVTPVLKKKPSSVIIVAGTNDALSKSADDIFDKLIDLKKYIENELPGCLVYISSPTPRYDIPHAQVTIKNLRRKLATLGSDVVISNDNISGDFIARKGLHLNEKGSSRLAMNFLSHIRSKT